MNQKARVEFIVGNGFFALRINDKYYGVVPVKATFEPIYLRLK